MGIEKITNRQERYVIEISKVMNIIIALTLSGGHLSSLPAKHGAFTCQAPVITGKRPGFANYPVAWNNK